MTPRDLMAAFETLADAPGGIKRLRELVLQLAVRGKLVPQDPGDEPAGKLLPRIARDVQEHVRQKHFRALQQPEPLPQPDKRIDVPTGWEAVHLANIAGRRSGNSKLIKGQQHDAAGPERFAGFSASGQDVWLDTFEHEGEAIIVSAVGARCGKCFAANGRWSAIANTHIVWPYASAVYLPFLMLHVNNERFWARSGGAQPFVKIEESFQSIIGLPPLAEQHRIVAKVDELIAFLDKLEAAKNARDATRTALRDAALAALRDADGPDEVEAAWGRIAGQMDDLFAEPGDVGPLRQAVLQLAVRGRLVRQVAGDEPAERLLERCLAARTRQLTATKNADLDSKSRNSTDKMLSIPTSWILVRLFDMAELRSGSPVEQGDEMADGPIAYVKVSDLGMPANRDGVVTSTRFVGLSYLGSSIKAGSILFPKRGGAIATNRKRLTRRELICDSNLMAMTPYLAEVTSYLQLWFSTIDLWALNTGTSVPQINNKDIYPLPLALPPLAEQHRIVAKVDELMVLLDKLEARLRAAQELQWAFAAAAVHHLDVEAAV